VRITCDEKHGGCDEGGDAPSVELEDLLTREHHEEGNGAGAAREDAHELGV